MSTSTKQNMTTILCRICLRSGLGTKDYDEKLGVFLGAICNFDVEKSGILSFCVICEHQLRKFYNFREKCRQAQRILKTKTTLRTKNIENLHQLMPPNSLGVLTVTARQGVFHYNYDELQLNSIQNLQTHVAAEAIEPTTEPIEVKFDTDLNTIIDTEDESNLDLVSLLNENADNLEEIELETKNKKNSLIDDKATTLEEFSDSDLDVDDPFYKLCFAKENNMQNSRKIDFHQSDCDTKEQEVTLSNKKTAPPNTSLTDDNMLSEELNYLSKRKTKRKKKLLIDTQRCVLELKEYVLQHMNDGNLDLGKNVTLTKEQFLEMYAKCDKSWLSRYKLLKQDHGYGARIIKFLLHLIKRYSPEYDTVFDIQYLTTEDSKLAEFQARKNYKQYLAAEFKCDKCYRWFAGQCMLDYHNKWHDPTRQHVCHICSMRFPTRLALTKHLNQLNGAHSCVYRCKLCDVLIYFFDGMFNHYRQHKGVTFSCDTCDHVFRTRTALFNHRARHTAYQCAYCSRRLLTSATLDSHIKLKHPHGETHMAYQCAYCSDGFMTSATLDSHIKLKHANAPPPTDDGSPRNSCARCDATKTRYPGIPCRHRRERSMIEGNKTYKCRSIDCEGAKFKTADELNEHILQTGHIQRTRYVGLKTSKIKKKDTLKDKPYRTCLICQEKVPNKNKIALFKHHQKKHPTDPYTPVVERDYLCEKCGKSFAGRTKYLDHLNKHSGERPFVCSLCPSRFSHLEGLITHKKDRHRPACHECSYCGKKFRSKPNLSVHLRIHIGNRCFKCEVCGKDFLHSGSLKEHVNGVHNQVRRVKKTKHKHNNKSSKTPAEVQSK